MFFTSSRIPGLISLHIRDEIQNRPFPLKIVRKMKCFQGHKWIRKQSYLAAFQISIPDLPSKTEGGRSKCFLGASSNLVVNSLFLFFQVDNCPFCLL